MTAAAYRLSEGIGGGIAPMRNSAAEQWAARFGLQGSIGDPLRGR
jgi:hypothetical protein